MRKSILFLMLLWPYMAIRAQNPQTQTQPTFRTDSTTANGVAPGYRPTKGAGLVLNIGPGNAACGSVVNYAGGTLTMTASVTNYVYLNADTSCAPAVKTTAFTQNDVQIATVVASGSAITSITDDRTSAINQEPNVIPRIVSGASDALVAGDVGGQVVYESSSATAVTLADLTAGWYSSFIASGSGGVTVTLTGSHQFVGGTTLTTLVVAQGAGCSITSDSSHYYPHCSPSTTGGGAAPVKVCSQVAIAMPTGAIASAALSSAVTGTCTGLTTADTINCSSAVEAFGVTGLLPSTNGILTINPWPTSNTIHVEYENDTSASVTPGALTVNCAVWR